ncbi:probable hydroxylase for synthesis of 2-methylthio-cis-ribozeatin in tRNA [Prochlorococcus marinus str. NATL2A]|uniref:Probable hydroxylase for synthesis of 2-methylthio-cis-ribozeatin in tRNA n=1 Tax=Prochlorococcus marinus (strain NATL2A) TaxID=59920 RepID=Q46H24_PROMT|nr:tRNA-(ms[2]io[6]A)-hydroxylase [Prochlorococcus marinus]AAZ59210.1 probable hydroxylase for synthesis of 2-methylthio-cis-ribozeatin in tRNA [Prochlorococcus marinus str. NATL2A]
MNNSKSQVAGPSKIRWLINKTSEDWIDLAISNPMEILLDHAHCERKAAGVALQLMFRYVSEPGLSEVLSPLAREELEHFERVLSILNARGQKLQKLASPPYGLTLAKNICKDEPLRMLDSFLVAGLIEARSHERMKLLSIHSPDVELRDLYADLLKSEARHFGIYWKLADERFERNLLTSRLEELAKVESDALLEMHHQPRMHS